ncbi:MAG: T9SS C-terminal target domain-containing protein, partial [Flavobacteriales bacterium]
SAYIEANNFFEFEDNVVNLPPGVLLFDENRPFSTYGLYVKSSINFSVEGNLFQMAGNAPTYMPIDLNGFPVGMVVNSTYTEMDAAYRNTFEGLELGILNLGQNRTNDWDGLQIRCNIFNDCSHDILVPIPDLYPENSVSHFQGYAQVGWTPQDLANNLFSHTNNDPNIISDFDNNGPYLLHYFRPFDPSEPRFEPRGNHIFRLHDGPQPDPTDWNDRCPQGFLVIKMDTTLVPSSLQRVVLDSLKNDYLSDVEALGQLIDQGNTPQLLADIFSYPESEYYYMFLDLMAQSPYLSEGVLIEVINLSNFPDVLLRNLLMENPQSVSSENILTAIIERTPALPQYMIDDILNGTDLFGPKEALESRIAHKNAKFKRFGVAVLKALTSEMAKDDEQAWLTDSLLSVLDAINTPHTMLMKAAFLQNYGMSGYELAYQAAISLLNGSDSLIQGEFEGFAEIMELSLSIEDSLSTNDIQTLEAWRYSNYPAAQSLAYSLLLEYGVATDSMLIDPLVTPASMLKTQRNRPSTQLSVNPNRMKLYPNPARDYTVLHYELKGVERTLNYRIMDLSGRTVLHGSFKAKVTGDEIITLPNVANGAYIILVEEVNGEPLESIKLNIFR